MIKELCSCTLLKRSTVCLEGSTNCIFDIKVTLKCNYCMEFLPHHKPDCSHNSTDYGVLSYPSPPPDSNIESPTHYSYSGLEPIEVIEKWELGFNLGNLIKYIARAGKKDKEKHLDDLNKGLYYLKREISKIEKEKNK